MSKFKDEHYYVVTGFMSNKLNLKGNELIIYAIINGFSQGEHGRFTGSASYLADAINASRNTVYNILKKMTEEGVLIKYDNYINGQSFPEYTINKNYTPTQKIGGGTQNFGGDTQKFWGGIPKNLGGDTQKIGHNNIEYNIDNNIEYNIDIPKIENSEVDLLDDVDVKKLKSAEQNKTTLSAAEEKEKSCAKKEKGPDDIVGDTYFPFNDEVRNGMNHFLMYLEETHRNKTVRSIYGKELHIKRLIEVAGDDNGKAIRALRYSYGKYKDIFAAPEDKKEVASGGGSTDELDMSSRWQRPTITPEEALRLMGLK